MSIYGKLTEATQKRMDEMGINFNAFDAADNIKKRNQKTPKIRRPHYDEIEVAIAIANLILLADMIESFAGQLRDQLKSGGDLKTAKEFYLPEVIRYCKYMRQNADSFFGPNDLERFGDMSEWISDILPAMRLVTNDQDRTLFADILPYIISIDTDEQRIKIMSTIKQLVTLKKPAEMVIV